MCEFLVDTVLTVRELSGTSGACFSVPLLLRQRLLCTILCVPDSRHGMHHGSRNLTFDMVAEPVCVEIIHGSAVDRVGRASKTDGGCVGFGTSCSANC